MKSTAKNLIPLLLVLAGIVWPLCDAQAKLAMSEREHVQTIVWIVEAATFLVVLAIGLFIWKISTQDRKNKDRGQAVDHTEGER